MTGDPSTIPLEDVLFQELATLLASQGRPEADRTLIAKAFAFAREKHAGQVRKTGEAYITHPVQVATILATMPADTPTVAAGLLHDVLEDCDVSDGELQKQFGEEVFKLVEGVTKLGKLQFESKAERNAENFRRMFLAMASDVRVIMLKLCDRLHNMRTLDAMKREKQLKKAFETIEVFAPLANRLGMGKLRAELEDLSFKYIEPDDYNRLIGEIEANRAQWDGTLQEMAGLMSSQLETLGIHGKVYGRIKNYFSIYKKMKQGDKQFHDIYDLAALRVIVGSEKECYEVLGIVHSNFKPVPGRFKDYIGIPKSNLYQSLHTVVIGPSGRPVEVQIRTEEMHQIAEYGIAAHWRYKESGSSVLAQSDEEQKLSWLKQMLEMKEDASDAQEYVESIKLDLFTDEVFVFTPKGDVFDLPQGSTPVDFAYRVHTQVGHTCVGAMVNGKIVTLDYPLRNGDIIEVKTSKNASPKLDWIKFVKTQHAKTSVRQWYKKNFKEDHIAQGEQLLVAELTRAHYEELTKNGAMQEVAEALNYTKIEDMLLALGYGELTLPRVMNRVKREQAELQKGAEPQKEETLANIALHNPNLYRKRKNGGKEEIEGLQGMLYHLAKCCSPLPGDGIIGVVTRSRGVMIHRDDCLNLSHVNPERKMIIGWMGTTQTMDKKSVHGVRLDVQVIDRVGILKDVLARIADTNTNVSNARVKMMNNNTAVIEITVDISDTDHLDRVIRGVGKLSDVLSVARSNLRPMKRQEG